MGIGTKWTIFKIRNTNIEHTCKNAWRYDPLEKANQNHYELSIHTRHNYYLESDLLILQNMSNNISENSRKQINWVLIWAILHHLYLIFWEILEKRWLQVANKYNSCLGNKYSGTFGVRQSNHIQIFFRIIKCFYHVD